MSEADVLKKKKEKVGIIKDECDKIVLMALKGQLHPLMALGQLTVLDSRAKAIISEERDKHPEGIKLSISVNAR